MVIRVLACALAPGDVRLLSGKTDYVLINSPSVVIRTWLGVMSVAL